MPARVQEADFDVSSEIDALTAGDSSIGAVATFIGKVRGETDGRSLDAMSLEHYPGMTEAELARMADEAAERFHLTAVSVVHRVGRLAPGDNIVLVVACAPHRRDAFDGCAFLMDYLKTRAPFWKKEEAQGGEGQWVDARDSDDDALVRWREAKD